MPRHSASWHTQQKIQFLSCLLYQLVVNMCIGSLPNQYRVKMFSFAYIKFNDNEIRSQMYILFTMMGLIQLPAKYDNCNTAELAQYIHIMCVYVKPSSCIHIY